MNKRFGRHIDSISLSWLSHGSLLVNGYCTTVVQYLMKEDTTVLRYNLEERYGELIGNAALRPFLMDL